MLVCMLSNANIAAAVSSPVHMLAVCSMWCIQCGSLLIRQAQNAGNLEWHTKQYLWCLAHNKQPTIHTQKSLVRYNGAVLLQPAPEDTSTEFDPKYRISYLASHEVAERPIYESEQEEAVAAAFAFSQLEASVSGVHNSPSNAEAISRQGMTASTSGTTIATENGDTCLHTTSSSTHVKLRSPSCTSVNAGLMIHSERSAI